MEQKLKQKAVEYLTGKGWKAGDTISLAHEICNAECFAFTGEGPKPHSQRCQHTARALTLAFREFGDPMQAEIERLRAARDAAVMAKTRLDDFADKAWAGHVHYDARELKRKIGAAFAEFDDAMRGADQQSTKQEK